ncbi:MAG: DNA polymerase III subunit delta' [Proteobacteria bacterium]|nr:DNA polymerase III subunit delta' [Pseudomonadota bacterium]
MARRTKPEEVEEPDRLEGFPHPRETMHFAGQGAALAIVSRAVRSGRPPQAWLISGAPGIGKATLAYRIARYLLRFGATDQGPEDLAVAQNDAVSAQVIAGAHPGLLVLKRSPNPNTGKLMTVLGVDEIRRLAGFFGMTSGAGGWRIAIVDTADDMNDAAANALLKALEEPPPRAMLMLLANAPGRLLPTIRSRCQRLALRPLPLCDLQAELAKHLPDLPQPKRASLAKLAGGSLGLALQLSGDDGLELAEAAERLIDGAANPDFAAIFAIAEKTGRMGDGLEKFGEFFVQALGARIRTRAETGNVQRWIELREQLIRNFSRASALHLEPKQTVLSSARSLSRTARNSPL